MANEIQIKLDAEADFTLTLASLAAGSARQSTIVSNANQRPSALIYLRIPSGGTAPAAGGIYTVYMLRDDDNATPYITDGGGAVDAAITIENAPILGTIVVTNDINKNFFGDFDTSSLGVLGSSWGIAVENNTNQALNSTETNFFKRFTTYLREIQ